MLPVCRSTTNTRFRWRQLTITLPGAKRESFRPFGWITNAAFAWAQSPPKSEIRCLVSAEKPNSEKWSDISQLQTTLPAASISKMQSSRSDFGEIAGTSSVRLQRPRWFPAGVRSMS